VPQPQHRVIEPGHIPVPHPATAPRPVDWLRPRPCRGQSPRAGFAKGVPTDGGIMKISVKLAFIAFVSTFAYLWLAIWGWADSPPFLPWRAGRGGACHPGDGRRFAVHRGQPQFRRT
jgi:hypothetical protein